MEYQLQDGKILYVQKMAAGDYCVFQKDETGERTERCCHKMLPICTTFEAAQTKLKAFAQARGLVLVSHEM